MPLRQSFMPQIHKFSSLLLYRHTKKPPAGMETFLLLKNIFLGKGVSQLTHQ